MLLFISKKRFFFVFIFIILLHRKFLINYELSEQKQENGAPFSTDKRIVFILPATPFFATH